MNECMVNKQGVLLEILQEDREPKEGEFKVSLNGYYEKLNGERYASTKWDSNLQQWVGVGNPIPIPPYVPTETEKLKVITSEQNQIMSELMDLLFAVVPELQGL